MSGIIGFVFHFKQSKCGKIEVERKYDFFNILTWWPFNLAYFLSIQGIDGSAWSPRSYRILTIWLRTTCHIAPYLGAFGTYLMPQRPIYGSTGVSIYQNNRWNLAVTSHYLPSVKKSHLICSKTPPKKKIQKNKQQLKFRNFFYV